MNQRITKNKEKKLIVIMTSPTKVLRTLCKSRVSRAYPMAKSQNVFLCIFNPPPRIIYTYQLISILTSIKEKVYRKKQAEFRLLSFSLFLFPAFDDFFLFLFLIVAGVTAAKTTEHVAHAAHAAFFTELAFGSATETAEHFFHAAHFTFGHFAHHIFGLLE